MRYIFDHDFHIHTMLSTNCDGALAQTPETILQYAVQNSLNTVITTDHYWDDRIPTDIQHGNVGNARIRSLLPYPQTGGVRMLIGAEAEVAPDFSLGVNRRTFDDFDFILISATHMGAPWFEFDGDPVDSIEARAKAYVRRFEAVFDADIPYHKVGLSHPVGSSIGPNHDLYCKVLDAIPDEEYRRIYGKAAELGIGLEINLASMRNHTIPEMPQHTPLRQPSVFRPYRIAKDVGCKFFIGSDAHFPNEFAWKPQTAETVIDQLDLKESDKFILK